MDENLAVFDFVLTDEEMAFVDALVQENPMHLYQHKPENIL